jgi:protein tyrosine phosphatase (PTP) superfamily phosphohydrolase (DUF442 family)
LTDFKQLSPDLAVRPQLEVSEIGELADQGYKGWCHLWMAPALQGVN